MSTPANTPDILKKILARKTQEIAERSQQLNLRELSQRIEHCPTPRPFCATLQQRVQMGEAAVIAEVKKASPSKGILRDPFDPNAIAQSYAEHGASCLSVLTDRDFFQGSEDYLRQAKAACQLPILRKDFIIDPYQVYEARWIGADCILLIVAALGDTTLRELAQLAHELSLDVLIEVHDQAELERGLALNPSIIGINNRNLRTFETQLSTTLELLPQIPDDCLVVTESGILNAADVTLMRDHQVHTFLVGEAFMREPNPGQKLAELFYGNNS